ncbi:MAG: N-6 DNA methylase [Spirochaetaceae bacterium]|jgi:hypothetical protein|nr:N-6 DNA methylase [Spirochaetaceae bacterium]
MNVGYTANMNQNHLDLKGAVNFGSFYTPEHLVDLVYNIIKKNAPDNERYIILDTSCGYGGFLRGEKSIGADIDKQAIQFARNNSYSVYFNHNSLLNISRKQYNLSKDEKLIIVGNPPYNDTTSIIRKDIKEKSCLKDDDVKARDLGISFLRSYNKLESDYVCVLHPLSYLIKKTNFNCLRLFTNNYRLTDSVVFSSGEFSATSKTTQFPVIAAFYERNLCGMNYNYIENYKFKTIDNKIFSIKNYDTIGNYASKYPNHKQVSQDETVAFFYTMRDINALKRAATFLDKETYNTVRITRNTLPYYCYADVLKDYTPHIPYYFGNNDIIIDNDAFLEIKNLFIQRSVEKHPQLCGIIEQKKYNNADIEIGKYFESLLGEHYMD